MTDAASINTPILIVPGLGGSGPDHWQTRWARLHPEFVTVLQDDWHRPDLAAWIARLDDAVLADRGGELGKLGLGEGPPRIVRVRRDAGDRDGALRRNGRRGWLGIETGNGP